ncbi:hypothetical protein DFQ27_009024 [Actinomortierella ambigua]|uniref:Uncharacterized protein n=1 Tax=Actinomortierella ambigua TaxID=1343610 RepID=A0A9P6PP53_9FUNG|nr:hypothetical protein DFQ27_009024 [Actinomortierella ambigua]
MSLNLEICDVIKDRQKNTPREAAIYIVRLVNNRNMHVGMLALALLDMCIKNCGHPFHIQIATKEFLNELVRKFPERPLSVPTPVQSRILEMIHEWYLTIAKTSRFKEDLVHIKDMHRLLSFKGYRFPQLRDDSTSVLNPVATLKSPAELEEEDRIAQSAKLQELIRRGRPQDVQAANDLVKKMTGYVSEERPDYKEEAALELEKVHQKAVLLTEMLNDVKPGERIGRNDIFQELLTTCKAAQPKIQKFINEGDDVENMDRLLEINDIINNVMEQYENVKQGRLTKVALPTGSSHNSTAKAGQDSTGNNNTSQAAESSLIDFDGDLGGSPTSSSTSSAGATPKVTGNLMDDLMNLSFNDSAPPPAWGAGGSIMLGGQSISSPAAASSSSRSSTPSIGGGVPLNGSGDSTAPPAYNMFSAPVTSVNPVSVGQVSSGVMIQPQHTASSSSSSSAAAGGFSGGFDEFDFVSNTGAPVKEPAVVTLIDKDGLKIELEVDYVHGDASEMNIKAMFSNRQSSPMSALTLRLAVPKSLQLRLEAQSSQSVPALSTRTVTQVMNIKNPSMQQPVRVRYHVSYQINGRQTDAQGEFNDFPLV